MTPAEREKLNSPGPSVGTMIIAIFVVLAAAFTFFWFASPPWRR